MKIFEFVDERDMQTAYYDPSKDTLTKRNLDDTRKPKLTLAAINRLKRMRALRKLEKLKHQDLISIMYSAGDDEAGGFPM